MTTPMTGDRPMPDLLHNVFWHCLTGPQAAHAAGTAGARRYAAGFSPIVAFENPADPDVAALAPHATLLPERNTRLNLNTADATALMAGIEGLDAAGANKLIAVRQLQHFRTPSDARALLGETVKIKDHLHGVSSNYFEVRGRLRLDDVTVHERSLVRRDGRRVNTVWRQRGAAVLASAGNAVTP